MTAKTTQIKVIGALFLVCGIIGSFNSILSLFMIREFIQLINIFPAVLFGITFYSGYLLLIKEDLKGIEYARAIIALQIIKFKILGVGYFFVTGGYLLFGTVNSEILLNFGMDNSFSLTFYHDDSKFTLQANILALAIFLYLTSIYNKMEAQDEVDNLLATNKYLTKEKNLHNSDYQKSDG